MEFEDMKKIWDEQNGEHLYAINEEALHNSVKRKKNAASRKINKVEIGISIINSIVAIVLFIDALNDPYLWDFFGAGIFALTVVYIQFFRKKRKQGEKQFDRSMLGELNHTISNTKAIMRFNLLMTFGYIAPISIFYIAKLYATSASLGKWSFVLGMFALAFFLTTIERKKIFIPKLLQLEKLKDKLSTTH